MSSVQHPIPGRLNLGIAAVQVFAMLALLWMAGRFHGWGLLAVAVAYGLVMNSAYAMLHEAEHGILHPNRHLNEGVGVVLALFFPAPFHLLRQGHLGHHLRNRSDDEAFDFYFEGENRLWRSLQLYGILTGMFWAVIAASNVVAAVWPWFLRPRRFAFDRPTEALLQSLNPRFLPAVWLEAVAAVTLHAGLLLWWAVPPLHWLAALAGFGFLWSAMQYVHHFGTSRDVVHGARNLRTWKWLDRLWLNHNWHLRHHRQPTVPWIHLPSLEDGESVPRGHLLPAYFTMWRGPRPATQRVENRHAGRLIR
jgi:fatty acid desaturase